MVNIKLNYNISYTFLKIEKNNINISKSINCNSKVIIIVVIYFSKHILYVCKTRIAYSLL